MQVEQTDVETVPWTTRDVWLGVVFLVAWLAAAVLSMVAVRFFSLKLDVGVFVSLAELVLLLPVWWLAVRKYRVDWSVLGLRGFAGRALGLGCALMGLSYAFNLLYSLFLAIFSLRMQTDLVPLFSRISSPALFLVGGALVAPFVEELFFRGFLFAGLRQKYGWRKAALISSALFALGHLQPTAMLPIFILGCIFAYLYERSRSIWPGILMHASSTALALGAAYLMFRSGLPH